MKKIIIIIGLGLSIILSYNGVKIDNNPEKKDVIDSVLSENNVYTMLLLYNIKYPEVVMSQIMIESAYLKSKLTKRNNNILGMTVATKRQTTAVNKKGFAKYLNWIDCIYDYKLYQDYILSKNSIISKKQYISFLHRTYAKAPNYKSRLTELSKVYEIKCITHL
jgi:hypothetical protein